MTRLGECATCGADVMLVNFDDQHGCRFCIGCSRRGADAPERMTFVKPAPSAELPRAGKGGMPYFGVMPDYGYDGKGV